jgi:membrane protease YdiL (CAAX protease family)
MKAFLEKFQFLTFSILTIIVSLLLWSIAKEQSGTIKMLLTQFGYFAPALVAIILTLIIAPQENLIRIKSYLTFVVVILCMVIIALAYGDKYYQIRIDNLLYENPLITITIAMTLIYFIWQIFVNKGANSIDRLVNLPKTKIVWYILAIGIYPVMKLIGVLISSKLFPTQIELPNINLIILIPLFLFSIIFYAGIGEEVGWRGFALKKLQMRYTPFVATLFIGIVWSIWHIGYFTLVENYALQSISSVVIWTFIASFFSTWFFNKTNGNVLILILFHASVNFAIIFTPHPVILTAFHLILLIIVLSTGRFFKKLKTEQTA